MRDNITETVGQLNVVMGNAWVETQFLPKLQELFSNEELNYLQRITILKALMHVNVSMDLMRPILRAAAESKVPNLRFAFCQVAKALAQMTDMDEFKE